jgi:hypothetical protein
MLAVWGWGIALIDFMLPVTRVVLEWLDDRFGILFLGIDRDAQDTVVRLRVSIEHLFFMNGKVIEVPPEGWLQVTTTTGAMLQPLTIAPAIALAMPGDLQQKILGCTMAVFLSCMFMMLDLPLTLFAYVWDMLVDSLEPGRSSPLLMWHEFLHSGGRLGVALVLGLLAWQLVRPGKQKT